MLNQSYHLNCCFFACVVISDLYLFQEIVLPNPCFMFSKNLILSYVDKVTIGIYNLALFISNVTSEVSVDGISEFRGLAFGLAGTSRVLDISDIIHFLHHGKSSPTSKLIKGKSRDSKNYSDILMEHQLLCLLYCYQLVCRLLFLSHTQRLTCCCVLVICVSNHMFRRVITFLKILKLPK